MIKGVLLDIDGTLVLSNDAHAHSWVEAFGQFGYKVTYEDVRKLIGMGGDKLIPKLVTGLSSKSGPGKKVSDYRTKLFMEKYAKTLKPAPGSRALVKRLLEDGLQLMVASSAKAEELKVLLKAAEVDDFLEQATTSDDAAHSKPDPDIVHAALDKIGLSPEQVIMLGDTPYDVEAAGSAAIRLIAVRCGGWDDNGLKGAIAIYDDPADILTNYKTSPLSK